MAEHKTGFVALNLNANDLLEMDASEVVALERQRELNIQAGFR